MSGTVSAKYHCKVVLLGNSGVGKTEFMHALFDDPDRELSALQRAKVSTIGVDFKSTTRVTRDSTVVKLLVWDTAGQERYASTAPNYTRESDAIVLLFDVTDERSYNDLDRRWQSIVDEHLDSVGRGNVVCYLVANKIDLADKRRVTREEGRAYANGRHMEYAETTVLRRRTVHNVIDDIADRLARMNRVAERAQRARAGGPQRGGTADIGRRPARSAGAQSRCCT